jgi:LysR family transcriptional regulator, hydrogen peroxide-inducible genes activator
MRTRQAEYFLLLADELNFTRAAARAGVAQPSLSKSIQMLEAELGAALLRRKPEVQLTPFGLLVRETLLRHQHELKLLRSAAPTPRSANTALGEGLSP